MVIRLTLLHSDVRHLRPYRPNVLISGDRNALLREIELREGQSFRHAPNYERYDWNPNRCQVLLPSQSSFRAIVALHIVSRNIGSRHPLRDRYVAPLLNVMRYIVQEFTPREVTFLPFSWRNPLFVAVGTLYAIIYSAYKVKKYVYQPTFEIQPNPIMSYIIISDSGIECYQDILANNGNVLKQIVHQSPDKNVLMKISEIHVSLQKEKDNMVEYRLEATPEFFNDWL